MFAGVPDLATAKLTLYTDGLIVRGALQTRHQRVTDMLNEADSPFIVLRDVTIDESGSPGRPVLTPFARVTIDAILFAIAEDEADRDPEMPAGTVREQVLLAVPPFRVSGAIDVPDAGGDLEQAILSLTGDFIPVLNGVYWSDLLRESRRRAALVAVNHRRVQLVAPHREVDPWAGLDQARLADTDWEQKPASDTESPPES